MSHAILSPSAAKRWMACTPSARLEQGFPNTTSQAADEGTLAHAIAELMLQRKTNMISELKYKSELKEHQKHGLYLAEMLDYCGDYTDRVMEQFLTAQRSTPDAQIFLETKIDLRRFIPDGFGTIDVRIVADGWLCITDLKYGKGVPVSAVDNEQLMIYALGALIKDSMLYDIHSIRMTIDQPRLDSYTVYEMSAAQLLSWGGVVLQPAADKAFKGEGDFKPGEHCRFCRAAATCRANHDFNMELGKHDFKEVFLLTDKEVSETLEKVDLLVKYANTIKDYALDQAVNHGKAWPGMKLVEGKSNRVYADLENVKNILLEKNFTLDEICEPLELLGITKMEKLLTKPIFNELLGPCIVKPKGKLTLVNEADKRPAHNSAASGAEAFKDVIIS